MTWTVVDDGDHINVRAVISRTAEQNELRDLIVALEKRLTTPRENLKEIPHDRDPA